MTTEFNGAKKAANLQKLSAMLNDHATCAEVWALMAQATTNFYRHDCIGIVEGLTAEATAAAEAELDAEDQSVLATISTFSSRLQALAEGLEESERSRM